MTEYIPIICFVAGTILGAVLTVLGFRLGFRSSYEIRSHKEESAEDKGLFKSKKDPAEFELLKGGAEENNG